MTNIELNEFFNYFQGKVNDPELFEMLDEEEIREFEMEWLDAALSNPEIHRIYNTIEKEILVSEIDGTETETIAYELKHPDKSASYCTRFTKDLLVEAMVAAWVEPRYYSAVNTGQFFGGKEEKFYAQSTHMDKLKDMMETAEKTYRASISGYVKTHNSYLEGKQ